MVTRDDFIFIYNIVGSGIYKKIPRNAIRDAFIDQGNTRAGSLLRSNRAVIVIKYSESNKKNQDVDRYLKLTLKEKTAMELADHAIRKFMEYKI